MWTNELVLSSGYSYLEQEMQVNTIAVFKNRIIMCDKSSGILYHLKSSPTMGSPKLRPIGILMKRLNSLRGNSFIDITI